MADIRPTQDELYEEAAAICGTALDRVARAYEVDPDKRPDLLQEIHLALWQSFEHFEGRCSLKTWVYRVAHNTATSVVIRQKAPQASRTSRFAGEPGFSLSRFSPARTRASARRSAELLVVGPTALPARRFGFDYLDRVRPAASRLDNRVNRYGLLCRIVHILCKTESTGGAPVAAQDR